MTDIKDESVREILKYPGMKYLIFALLALFIIFISYSFGYHLYRCHKDRNSRFLWGIGECLECKDTIINAITKHDTIIKYKTITIPDTKSNSGILQKNKNGENNSNSGTNFGNIGGSGNKVENKLSEPMFSQSTLNDILEKINLKLKENGISKSSSIQIMKSNNSNASTAIVQLKNFLEKNGFEADSNGELIGSLLEGVKVDIDYYFVGADLHKIKYVQIRIGVLKNGEN